MDTSHPSLSTIFISLAVDNWPWLLIVPAAPLVFFAIVFGHEWLCDKSIPYKNCSRWLWRWIDELVPVIVGCLIIVIVAIGMLRSCTDSSDHCRSAQEAKFTDCS